MKSNKTALFQSMNLIEFNYYNKSTRDIQLFKEGRLIDDFKIVKNNFNSLTYGLGIIDIIDKALPNSYQDSQMFDIAFKCLNKINDNEDYKELSTLTVGAPVGDKASAVMIAKDKILMIGGQQKGEGYSASNSAIVIDISDSFNL